MKKTFLALLAIISLAACTKMEVEYTSTDEIGFNIVSGKMTKSAVVGTTYDEGLNMYVFAATCTETTNGTTTTYTLDDNTGKANYINKGEFSNRGNYNTYVPGAQDATNPKVWGGTPEAYYWPNVKKLFFAGISKSGNVSNLSANGENPAISMNFNGNGTLNINGYEPGTGTDTAGDNDLMWFSKTAAYGKGTKYVHVDMYHTCSWITVKVFGDNVTAKSGTTWKVHNITINGITTKGNVTLTENTADTPNAPGAAWTLSTATSDINKSIIVFNGEATQLTTTATALENIANNTIVLPQASTNMDITYSYTSPAGATITETANVSLALDKSANATADANKWKPGYHYTYTVQITASEILIQPDAKTWNDSAIGDIII